MNYWHHIKTLKDHDNIVNIKGFISGPSSSLNLMCLRKYLSLSLQGGWSFEVLRVMLECSKFQCTVSGAKGTPPPKPGRLDPPKAY